MFLFTSRSAAFFSVLMVCACSSSAPRAFQSQAVVPPPAARAAPLDGELGGYLMALDSSPALQAVSARARAAGHRSEGARAWPRPSVSYTAFARPVETRVGPQRQRVGLVVPIAWPGGRDADRRARTSAASAANARVDARRLELSLLVANTYWSLWSHQRHHEHLSELEAMLQTAQEVAEARLVTGGRLASVQRLALELERLAVHRSAHEASAATQQASMRRLLGLEPSAQVPISTTPPALARVAEPVEVLMSAAADGPSMRAHLAEGDASIAASERTRADRWPDLALRIDWIETGNARGTAPVTRNGQDALMIGVSITLPTGLSRDRHEAQAALADADAYAHEAQAASDRARMGVSVALTHIQSSIDRAERLRSAIEGQALAAVDAALASYVAAQGTLDELLGAIRTVVDLRIEHDAALMEHAVAWARLEYAVGREVMREGVREDVRAETPNGVREDVREGVREDVREGVRGDVREGVRGDVREGVRRGAREDVRESAQEDREGVRERVQDERAVNGGAAQEAPDA